MDITDTSAWPLCVRGRAIVTADSLNVRVGPSITASVLGKLRAGQVVDIWAESAPWLLVQDAEPGALTGWCSSLYLRLEWLHRDGLPAALLTDANPVPVIELPPSSFGPLGLTLDNPDAGGGDGQGGSIIPARSAKWFDERQTCPRVLARVHDGSQVGFAGCPQYRDGHHCGRNGKLCLFRESPDHPLWKAALDWRYVPEVGAVIHRTLWAEYGLAE